MKNSANEHNSNFDDYEDLTLFADESFDTEDVDLFEFSSEDDSILTRLKSIILSLDWEINDEILEELADEVTVLQNEWQDDKVATVYLQGLDKIGRYIKSKGAYAHPNAIKLLLTFYYNFEKITSSESIKGDEIALLLKGDIRKFRILQYQINQEEGGATPAVVSEAPILLQSDAEETAVTPEEKDHLKLLKASILSLDWEVTDASLKQFNKQLNRFQETAADDKPVMVFIQGLRALGDYIEESAANAHPEAFTLLHTFSEGLEQVLHVEPEQRDQEQLQELLTDRIARLNALKALIVKETHIPPQEIVDEIVGEILPEEEMGPPAEEFPAPTDELSIPLEEALAGSMETSENGDGDIDIFIELDELFPDEVMPAMETSDEKYPDQVLPPEAITPIDDEVSDEYITSELRNKREIAPALSDADEAFGFTEDAEPLDLPAQSDLNQQLDKLFEDGLLDDVEESESTPEESADKGDLEAALANVALPTQEDEQPAGLAEDESDSLDIESKLDSFFADDDEETPAVEPAISFDAEPEEEDDGMTPALAGENEEQGFSLEDSAEALDESPLDDIEEKLDSFFDENAFAPSLADEEAPVEGAGESSASFDNADSPVTAALDAALAGEEVPEKIAQGNEQEEQELEEQLDDFFGTDPEEAPAIALEDTLPSALEEAAKQEAVVDGHDAALVRLAALGAVLPEVVRAPKDEQITEAAQLVDELKASVTSPEHIVLTGFMGAVVDQLVHSRFIDLAATEKLINGLYEKLQQETLSTADLASGMDQFFSWQKEVVNAAARENAGGFLPSAGQTPAPETTTATSELDVIQIRSIIREEFNQLKDELKG
ncbi:MAG: hypothetical protein CSB34_04350 [Desulfobulbus propionicus]|nr:MAG: hypothetical protein CSB34_04350 [Desulfobulbus propionicus]